MLDVNGSFVGAYAKLVHIWADLDMQDGKLVQKMYIFETQIGKIGSRLLPKVREGLLLIFSMDWLCDLQIYWLDYVAFFFLTKYMELIMQCLEEFIIPGWIHCYQWSFLGLNLFDWFWCSKYNAVGAELGSTV